jgi:hypothetical protein
LRCIIEKLFELVIAGCGRPTPMSPKPDLSSEWVKAIEMKSIDDTLKVLESETPGAS